MNVIMEDNIPESATNKLHKLIVSWRRKFVDKMEKEIREIEKLIKHEIRTNWPRQIKLSVPKVGDTYVLENLILEGANLDVLEQRGINCMPYFFWNPDIISFFLERHSRDINSCDCWGNTALILAARYSLYSVVQFLLANGADPNIRNLKGETALFVLVNEALESIQATAIPGEDDFSEKARKISVEMLLKSGADIESINSKGLTILHSWQTYSKFLSNKSIFENINVRCSKLNYERTPIINAAVGGDWDYIFDLVNKSNAEVNAKDMVGFTALHYAAIEEESACYSILTVEKASSADMNALTNSGRSVYELACLSGKRFYGMTKNEEPARQIMVCELEGAFAILSERDYKSGIKDWNTALHLRTNFNMPKLTELTEKQKSVYKITKEYETKQELVHLLRNKVDLISTALLTLERNGVDCEIGCWNLLFGINKVIHWEDQSLIRNYPIIFERVMDILTYVSENMLKIPESNYKGLLDYPHTEIVRQLISFFYYKLTRMVGFDFPEHEQDEYILRWRPHVHFLAKLCSVYLRAWKNKVESKVTPCFGMLFRVCCLLEDMHCKVPNQADLNLIWDIARQDPRDYSGNTIMHLACYGWNITLMKALLDHDGAYVMSYMNVYGETPIQVIIPGYLRMCDAEIVGQFVRNGAHIDFKNIHPGSCRYPVNSVPAEQCLIFPYVSLQCLCARALLKSEVLYKDKVPKRIEDFINSHSVPELESEPLEWRTEPDTMNQGSTNGSRVELTSDSIHSRISPLAFNNTKSG